MPTPVSGAISLLNVNNALSRSPTAQISIGSGAVRNLAGVYSGPIGFRDLYNKPVSGGAAFSGNVELMVVAGGGGGGRSGDDGGGGGGAGGLIYVTGLSLVAGSFPVTIGAGGAATGLASGGTDGSPSSAFGFVAIGGGAGGGRSGGSGGGGNSTNYPGAGAGTPGQGNNGGAATGGHYTPGGGGGGAGGVGGTAGGPGPGGIGRQIAINGTATYYAGGGGGANLGGAGGAGGLGGGGQGGGPEYSVGGSPGTNGLGGGGGGSPAGPLPAAAGGSGVVIVAYPGDTPIATGGSISTTSRPGYVVHTFQSTGVFTI